MTDSSHNPEESKKSFSLSKNLYWLLVLLIPIAWWIAAGVYDRVQRIIIASTGLAIFLAGFLVCYLALKNKMAEERSQERPAKLFPNNYFWFILFLLSVFWWIIAGHTDKFKSILLAAVSLAAFMLGV
ncbi:MAG TPA: hypothetical protein VN658_09520, partial [Candidatus Acidoferrales bacterium]|nr:hypothetical protein [Candidatus Acidoferrales bacterium]